eukprot:COSAG01_NODE_1490_length_10131_cov_15.364135_5_plen_72_part_00
MDHFQIPSVTIKNGLAAEATQGSCKSRALKWGILRNSIVNAFSQLEETSGAIVGTARLASRLRIENYRAAK